MNSLATITLNALEINGSTINGTTINGSTIVFGNPRGTNVTASESSNGILFSGTGPINFNSSDLFKIQNLSPDGVVRGKIATDMWNGTSKQNALRLIAYDQSATESSDPSDTRACEFAMLSQNAQASGIGADNRVELNIYDGETNTIKAFLRIDYNKDSDEATVNLGVGKYTTDGTIRITNDGSIYLNKRKLTFSGGVVGYE